MRVGYLEKAAEHRADDFGDLLGTRLPRAASRSVRLVKPETSTKTTVPTTCRLALFGDSASQLSAIRGRYGVSTDGAVLPSTDGAELNSTEGAVLKTSCP